MSSKVPIYGGKKPCTIEKKTLIPAYSVHFLKETVAQDIF
jgi:hypothetical protein